MKPGKVDSHIGEQMKDPYFRELQLIESQKLDLVKPIIAYRIKHKLNQSQLAKMTGVTQQHISKIESGDFSNMATLQKVLLYVGYTVRLTAVPLKSTISQRIFKRRAEAA